LAQPTKNPAFARQPLTRADIEAYRTRALEEAGNALGLLASGIEQLPPADREKGNAVLARRDSLLRRIETYSSMAPQGVKIRIHGDYHLSQVLVTRNDFVIIDFEGEPGHSIEERRAKHSPLRDVAGMLRSFSYVQHSALRNVAHDEAEMARLAPLAHAWAMAVRGAFLAAYHEASRTAKLQGTDVPAARGLLGLFELEKALYELRYELGNRPGWAAIPLQGILNLDAD